MTRLIVSLTVLALAGAGAGYALFSLALGGTPKIAVMNGPLVVTDFNEGVITFELANALETKLDFVASNPDIKALVVRINSPGGEATSSERLYAAMADVRRDIPVVVSAQWLLASGSYMMAMGANYVFANSGSNIGSVGVISFVTPRGFPSEFQVGTGPSKVVGSSERTLFEELELLKEAFYALVASERGGLLRLEKGDLLSGDTWLGVRAVQLGLVDELGDDRDAIRKAAELAGLRRYEVVQLEQMMTEAGGLYAEAVVTAGAHDPELDFLFELKGAANPLAIAGGLLDGTGSSDRSLAGLKERALEVSRGPEPHLYHLYLPP